MRETNPLRKWSKENRRPNARRSCPAAQRQWKEWAVGSVSGPEWDYKPRANRFKMDSGRPSR